VDEALSSAKSQEERYRHALRLVCSARAARGGHLYVPTPEAPQRVATCDLPEPSTRLSDHVRDLLEIEQDRFETMTIALEQIPITQASATIVHADGIDYELLMLTHFTAEEAHVAGVIALAPGSHGSTHPLQTQLLATIAAQLSAAARESSEPSA
jgi:hypothetical protein